MKRYPLFTFPDPVNEVSARLVAGGVAALAAGTLATGASWLLAVLAYGFLARVLAGPRLSPLALLVTRGIVPRLPLEPRPVPGPPKRFAQGIGAALTTTAAVLALGFGAETLAFGLVGLLLGFALLESLAGFCAGCWLFGHLMRIGVVPASVCERCAPDPVP